MNYFDLYLSYPDQTITATWYSQVAQAEQAPGLAEILLRRGNQVFPRFPACYAELRVLPHGARRAPQRRIARSAELAAIFPEWLGSRRNSISALFAGGPKSAEALYFGDYIAATFAKTG